MAILFLDLQKILQVADSGQALPLEDISYKLYIKSEDGGKPVAFDNWLWIKANKAQLQRQSLFMFDQNQNDIRELLLTAATRDRWPGYNNVKISVKR
ncbi:hypothetical protein GNI_039930 [Gregarina niphandrodes]|uniref:Uncharacterized protein n=1 Tax=Gregarina niphandrodes TaxID=110365 RepID=A0A023BAA3_GRENI|nr:hypothetical protein GNI_039930 [Gregarina niphandrodes]EZG78193.1 hypothetical protein GNI_039930 [Gregarina niphandrodes]|eukprot:XP_011129413.1 hypothetical protein GNI_039930 [Gregarina niphandrodes]